MATVTFSIYEPEKAQGIIEKLSVERLERMLNLLTKAPNGDSAIPAMIEQIKAEISRRAI